jgi:hypothetical protein
MYNHSLFKIVILGMACLWSGTVAAQFNELRGPRINDRLPASRMGSGIGQISGPRLPALRQLRGGGHNNWLQDLTSGTAFFGDGPITGGITADAGFGTLGFNFFRRLGVNRQASPSAQEGFKVGLGPLLFQNFSGGLGVFYTDFHTPSGVNDDSGWSAAITLSSTVSLSLPWLSFGGQLSGYYLPFVDKWGYGLPSPILSFGSQFGVFDPGASMGLGIKGSLAGWDWIVFDVFRASYAQTNIADYIFDNESGNAQIWGRMSASLPSESAVDQVGRYQFGGGAYLERPADASSRFQAPRFANNGSLFSQDRTFYTNSAGVIVAKWISPVVRNMNWFKRDDFWATTDFNSFGNIIRGGTYFDHVGNEQFRPYLGYEFTTRDEFESLHHVVNTGSYGSLTESTTYFANLGWVWGTGGDSTVSKGLYELILSQMLSMRFSHFLGGGRTVTDPDFGERYIADYVNYGLNFALNAQTMIQAVTGISQTDGRLTRSGDATRSYQGLRIRTALGGSNVSVSAIHENYDFKGGGVNQLDQWIYKILYGLPIGGPRSMAYTGYQYIDRRSTSGGTSSFQEHLFLLYFVHRF